MAQQHGVPCLPTLADNTLHDIVSRVDGRDLLSLLATCRELHGNAALKACLMAAVLQQLAALQAALEVMVQALEEAVAMQQWASSLLDALEDVALAALQVEVEEQPAVVFDLERWRACYNAYRGLRGMIGGERRGLKLAAIAQLRNVKLLLQQALATGQPGQQAPAAGQPGQQAPAVGQPGQQAPAVGPPAGHQAPAAGQPGQPEQQAAGQQLGPMVAQGRQEAVEALQLMGPGQPAEQAEAASRLALQAAVTALLVGQRQAGGTLQAVVQARTQRLERCARGMVEKVVQQGLEMLQGDFDVDDNLLQALQAAVHAGQAVLQELTVTE